MKTKKADMNFWLVMLVIALIFMVIMFFVMNNVFQKWGETTGKVEKQVSKELEETPPLFGTSKEGSAEESTEKGT